MLTFKGMRFPTDVIMVCIRRHGHGSDSDPVKVAMDKGGANEAAIDAINVGRDMPILVCLVKYLNNIVKHNHRAFKRVTRPMLNFTSVRPAGSVLAGIELIHMIRKG